MFALSTCQRSLAQTIQVPVSATNRQRKPKILMRYSTRPRGVQWCLCWADSSSGSGGGRGGASVTQTTLSFSSCMGLLLRHARSVLFAAPCGCGAHGANPVVGTPPLRTHQCLLTEQPVHTLEIVPKPEQQLRHQFEIQAGAVAGRHRAREEFVEAPPVRGGPGEV